MIRQAKKSSSCGQMKPFSEFHKNRKGSNGLQGNCKKCNVRIAQQAEWNKAGIKMTEDEYERLAESQGNRCALCGRRPGSKRLAVDHDHFTKRVRELLCMACNTAIGKLGEDPALFRKAASYIERHRRVD